MEELAKKLEEKYGFVLTRKEAREAMKVSASTIKRMETKGKIVSIVDDSRVVKFTPQEVARVMLGGQNDNS